MRYHGQVERQSEDRRWGVGNVPGAAMGRAVVLLEMLRARLSREWLMIVGCTCQPCGLALIEGAPSAGHSEALYSTNLLNKIRLARFSFLISFELFYFDNLVGQSYNAMGAYLSNASKHPTPLLIMQARRKHTSQCT